jgi:hypothetical protein
MAVVAAVPKDPPHEFKKMQLKNHTKLKYIAFLIIIIYLVCEAIGNAATPCLLCQPRVIVKMIVEK